MCLSMSERMREHKEENGIGKARKDEKGWWRKLYRKKI